MSSTSARQANQHLSLNDHLTSLVVDYSLAEVLEILVDYYSLAGLAQSLQEVCESKADHLEANWQDKLGAKSWRKDSRNLQKISLEN